MVSESTLLINGVITIAINAVSVVGQHLLNKRSRKRQYAENWCRELRSTCRQLKRNAIQVDPTIVIEEDDLEGHTSPDIQELVDLLEQTTELYDEMPDSLENGNLDEALSELVSWYHVPSYEGVRFTGAEVTENIVDLSLNVLGAIENR